MDEPDKEKSELIEHYDLRLDPIVFNHTPKLGEPPKQGEVDGERK